MFSRSSTGRFRESSSGGATTERSGRFADRRPFSVELESGATTDLAAELVGDRWTIYKPPQAPPSWAIPLTFIL